MAFDWQCPFCGRHATVGESNIDRASTFCAKISGDGALRLDSIFIVCPSPACKKVTLNISLNHGTRNASGTWIVRDTILDQQLIPASRAQTIPDYVPKAIIGDYAEACLIESLSPKASATLSRRCLQGILRDYWKVKPGRLVDEIEAVKDKMDPATWDAIDAVRKVGNIGAHMEKDIDVIIDVEPHEAGLLIGLIETLIKDWYILREERRVRLAQIKDLAKSKAQ